MKREEVLFFFSTLFFILAELLYVWGPPVWFSLFPYSVGLRFLLALEVYFLCCVVFFSLHSVSFMSEKKFAFMKCFCLSFVAVPVFSLLVMLNLSIQILQVFSRGLDIAIWLFISILVFRKSIWERFLLSTLFVLSGFFLLFPVIPSVIVITMRLLLLTLFSVRSFMAVLSSGSESTVQCAVDFRVVADRFALSPRETEVFVLLVAGHTNNEIALALFISLSTVKTHIASIFEKTGVRNRLEAAALCKKL